jgi:single-strand DNA-binding protein
MYQKLDIIGNLGRDPEMKYLEDGTAVTTFSVAVNRKYKNKYSEQKSDVSWFRVSVFGNHAEPCNTYLHKGSLVFVSGRLNADSATGGPRIYNKQDGQPATSFEVVASEVKFLSTNGEKQEEQTEF